jgi:hypothetical protein
LYSLHAMSCTCRVIGSGWYDTTPRVVSLPLPLHSTQCGSVLLGCSSLLSTGPSYSLERELETHVTIRRSRDLPSSSGLSSLRTQDTDTWRTRLSRIMTPPPSQAASSADINTCSDHVEDTCHHPADRCLLTLERRMTGLARQIRKFDLTPPKLMSPFCKNERSFKQKH